MHFLSHPMLFQLNDICHPPLHRFNKQYSLSVYICSALFYFSTQAANWNTISSYWSTDRIECFVIGPSVIACTSILVWNYCVVQTWKRNNSWLLLQTKTLITSVCISGNFDSFINITSQISRQFINKTALAMFSSSQTNAGALWFMRCIQLLYVTDAF